MINKKRLLIIFSCVSLCFLTYTVMSKCTYEWEKIDESLIGQYKLYVKDCFGNHVNGTVHITYINGKSEKVSVDKSGNIYVKKVIKDVKNPRRK